MPLLMMGILLLLDISCSIRHLSMRSDERRRGGGGRWGRGLGDGGGGQRGRGGGGGGCCKVNVTLMHSYDITM